MVNQLSFDFSKPASKLPEAPVAARPHPADKIADEADATPTILSVSDLNRNIKGLIEGQFGLVWLRGEISNFKGHSSGHFYFCLKDAKAQIKAVMFRGFNGRLKFRPEDGMEVIVRGRVSVYEPRGDYQIMCELMEPVGAGALQKAFEQLKLKLSKEGLFDEARKRPLPLFPRHIAIVTSPTGAAIRDMLSVLKRRFCGAQVTLVPTVVQGEQAPPQIVAAIQKVSLLKNVDVMIVGRGGGSIEDLWCFNDERVARAIAASPVPTISGVGHEVDFTIADFVADIRAPTPSAAAELVVQNSEELLERIVRCRRAVCVHIQRTIANEKRHLENFSKRLIDPQRRLQDLSLRCDDLTQRLQLSVQRRFNELRAHINLNRERLGNPRERILSCHQHLRLAAYKLMQAEMARLERGRRQMAQLAAVLESLSPLKVVARGYAIVTTVDNAIVTNSKSLHVHQEVRLKFAHGSADARIERVNQTNVSDKNKMTE